MVKKGFLLLAILLLPTNLLAAQQKEAVVKEVFVEEQDAVSFGVQAAKLTDFIIKTNGKFEEKLQLSLQLPSSFGTSLPRSKVMLTAYNGNGNVLGKQIWCSATSGKVERISADTLQVTFDVNPKLAGASKYSLTMTQGEAGASPFEGITCQECVNLAKDTCGRGGVQSVTCGADGGCSFTCKQGEIQ